jgi:hypothetical protein
MKCFEPARSADSAWPHQERLAEGLEHGIGLQGHDPQCGRKLNGLQPTIGEFNAFLMCEAGGDGARLKEVAGALLPSLRVNRCGVNDEFEVRSLRVAVWPDLE